MIAVSLFAFYPLSTNVSAATLNNVDILNSINAVQTNTRYYGLGQCYGFAKKTFASIFHLDVQDVSWDYTNGTTGSTYLYSVMKTKSKSELTTLLSLAQAGDVFCYGGGGGNPHSMIFVSNDEANQEVTVLDANWGAYNIIKMHAISYDQLLQIISWGNTMALFRFTPAGIALSAETATINLGAQDGTASVQLTCSTSPETSSAATWSSSDGSTAAVDQNGLVTSVAEGTAVITCQIGDKSAQCIITVADTTPTVTTVKSDFSPLIDRNPFPYSAETQQIAATPSALGNSPHGDAVAMGNSPILTLVR